MEDKKTRTGDYFILGSMFIWSFFPVVTKLTLQNISPLVAYLLAVIFSIIPFLFLVIKNNRWREMSSSVVRDSFWSAFWIGIVFYGLYFFALDYTKAGNAGIAAQSEVLWSFLFFNVLRRENFEKRHLIGILLMLAGALIVLSPKSSGWYLGDAILLISTASGPIGNFFQRRARNVASSETVLLLRAIFTIPMLGILMLFFKENLALSTFTPTLIILFILNGAIIMGLSKIFWLEGIWRIPVAKGNAIHTLSPFVVIILSYFLLKENPTIFQFASLIPFALGMLLLSTNYSFGLKSKKV